MAGKIIAVVAPTRSGKSFLVERLARHYQAPALYEVESDGIPDEVQESTKTGHSILGWLYFRNRSVQIHTDALRLAEKNPIVFLDACWVSNPPYISFYDVDPFRKSLLATIHKLDSSTFPFPDVIVALEADEPTSERLWRLSGRDFEKGDRYFKERLIPLKREFEKYMSGLNTPCPILKINRTGLDFDKPEHLKMVTDKIDAALSAH